MRFKIRTGLMLPLLLLLPAVGLAILGGVSALINQVLEHEDEEKAQLMVRTVSSLLSRQVIDNERFPASRELRRLAADNPAILYAYLVDFDGRLFAHSFSKGFPRELWPPTETEKNPAAGGVKFARYSLDDRPIRETSYPLIEGMSARLYLGFDQSKVVAAQQALSRRVGVITILILGLSLILGWLLAHRLSRPLEDFSRQLADHEEGKPLPRIEPPPGSTIEVAVMIDNFNKLAAKQGQLELRLRENITELNREIGERRQAQAELQRSNRELEQSNQEISRLAEVMAHHFQEPSRRLLTYAKRLIDRSALVEDEDSRLALEFIDQQARRLSWLVGDIQRYLALDHAKEGAEVTVDSAALLREVIAQTAGAAEGEIVLLEPLPKVRLEEKRLRLIFTSLLENAIRYRHSQRPLRIEVGAEPRGDRALFRFADNGSGIDPEYRAQVFKLFTRLVPSSTPGTGVGLALVRKIVQQADGSVSVEDGLDGGTAIVFDLSMDLSGDLSGDLSEEAHYAQKAIDYPLG